MDIADYAIDLKGKDWSAMLSGWADLLPSQFLLRFVNRFGDAFLVFDDGSVHMLDVSCGMIERLADSQDDFYDQLDLDHKANNWLMIPLVDQCVAAGLVPAEHQCYCFKISPLFSEGEYSVENIGLISIAEYYSWLAELFRQTKDLPDETQVELRIGARPEE